MRMPVGRLWALALILAASACHAIPDDDMSGTDLHSTSRRLHLRVILDVDVLGSSTSFRIEVSRYPRHALP
jgi:hypothetical protein